MRLIKQLDFVANVFDTRMGSLIFFVTNKCNSRCRTCFYWKNLNTGQQELSIDEIKKISKNIGPLRTLLISGGEPFLRTDLIDICKTFYLQNKTNNISIPTNSLLKERVLEFTNKILSECPNLVLSINLSLDGLEETHDYMRGIPGNFKKVMDLEQSLRPFKKKYPNRLRVNTSTVVSDYNFKEMRALLAYVRANMDVDFHSFEVMRGDFRDKTLIPLSKEQMAEYTKINLENDKYYIQKHFNTFETKYFWERKKCFYDMQSKVLEGDHLPLRCLAGKTVSVIEPNGDVKLCEMLGSVGNLRNYGYNLKRVLNSKLSKKLFTFIKNSKCSCTHCIFLYSTMEHNPLFSLVKLPMKAIFNNGSK